MGSDSIDAMSLESLKGFLDLFLRRATTHPLSQAAGVGGFAGMGSVTLPENGGKGRTLAKRISGVGIRNVAIFQTRTQVHTAGMGGIFVILLIL